MLLVPALQPDRDAIGAVHAATHPTQSSSPATPSCRYATAETGSSTHLLTAEAPHVSAATDAVLATSGTRTGSSNTPQSPTVSTPTPTATWISASRHVPAAAGDDGTTKRGSVWSAIRPHAIPESRIASAAVLDDAGARLRR